MAQRLAYWTLPGGVYEAASDAYRSYRLLKTTPEDRRILESNLASRGRHAGQRCFILATGPSIRQQDLTPLASEHCIGASDFYRHEAYELIKPAYHVLVPLHEPFKAEDGIRRATELSERASPTQVVFTGLTDRGILERSNALQRQAHVHYLNLVGMKDRPDVLDLTRPLPFVSSATVMALWVAIWMQFKEIYLLGCDHNLIWTWDGSDQHNLQHFYNGAPSIGYLPFDIDKSLEAHLAVRQQYAWTKRMADAAGLTIYNASPGSYLNIFPRADLESVLQSRMTATQ